MRYCTEDEEVLSANATSAYEAMVALGAQDVEAYNLGAFNHNDCALSAIATSVLWFLSMESTTDVEQTGSLEPCLAWETLDALGRRCPEDERWGGVQFKRCLETGRVEKILKFP